MGSVLRTAAPLHLMLKVYTSFYSQACVLVMLKWPVYSVFGCSCCNNNPLLRIYVLLEEFLWKLKVDTVHSYVVLLLFFIKFRDILLQCTQCCCSSCLPHLHQRLECSDAHGWWVQSQYLQRTRVGVSRGDVSIMLTSPPHPPFHTSINF